MIGNALEQEIIDLYNVELSAMYSINQIATLLKKKYPYINKKVTFLINQNIFKVTVIGRSHLCSLNLRNEETIYALILNEIRKKRAELEKNSSLKKINAYIEKLSRTADLKVVLKTKENILFISETEESSSNMHKGILKQAFQNYKIDVLSKETFLKMLVNDKILQQERIILYGFEKYFECIKEVEDELKLKYSKLLP